MEEIEVSVGGENYTVTIQDGVIDEIQQNGINLTEFFTDEVYMEILDLCK